MNQPPVGSRRPSGATIIAGLLILILAIVTIVSALTVFQLPNPVTTQAEDIESLWQVTLVISLVVFFLVAAGIIWACFRYRRRDDTIPEQIHGSSVLEFTWTIIPIMILVGLFIPSLLLLNDLKSPPDEDEVYLTVEAVGHQWWWEFQYPDDGITVQATPPDYDNLEPPSLVVPVGKTVVIKVRSTDVIHSFYVIKTLYKIQAVPGNINEMHINVTEPGVYFGQCYQFCGLRHSDMLFVLDARSEEDYLAWVEETQQEQGANGDEAASADSDNNE